MYLHDPHHPDIIGDAHAGSTKNTLSIRRCAACGALFAPPTTACSSCGSSHLETVASSGVGSVMSWRTVERLGKDGDREPMPLTIAIVELDEGPWVYTSIEGSLPSPPDRPVRVRLQPRPWTDGFPVFGIIPSP
ncbi:Zn-ribbon domain-containing OB-fold protein [Nocardia shimofusensis]|uniref:Zn-ribbon domain-containing OB-fold protein n=1 Tax=Nocardia shimofusensis TaxID=228596 RepID=UPI000834B9D3|nr:OB-fold domain-containing protein [Nocardia shimofusensis]